MQRRFLAPVAVLSLCLTGACGDMGGTSAPGGAATSGGEAAPAVKNELVVKTASGPEETLPVKHANYSSNTMAGGDEAGNKVVWPIYYISVSNNEPPAGTLGTPPHKEGEKRFMITIYGVPGDDKSTPPKPGVYPVQSEAKDRYKTGTFLSEVHMTYLADGSQKRDDWYGLKGTVKVISSTPEAIALELDLQANDNRTLKGSFKAEPAT